MALLVAIFNARLKNCYFPPSCKITIIIGIPKPEKPRDLPSSYRSIKRECLKVQRSCRFCTPHSQMTFRNRKQAFNSRSSLTTQHYSGSCSVGDIVPRLQRAIDELTCITTATCESREATVKEIRSAGSRGGAEIAGTFIDMGIEPTTYTAAALCCRSQTHYKLHAEINIV
ncbi:hypothetical protein EVAR_53053_1 [Eumeta japonica]|uniref:Uncharacterized protein n=1 Tax=Eumeta variegata TaxID=151549 RepID=A0A4C1YXQ1_EUMVA|nr:hypothetical protein EVAR_53053_1 [Eumeta japonica]